MTHQLVFPSVWVPLYKSDSKGNVRIWKIEANRTPGTYEVTYGLEHGTMQKTTVKVEPKNVGRSNETSEHDQAYLEAGSLWRKKQDSGYTLHAHARASHLTAAKALLPMLAQSFKNSYKHIAYPCYAQPKLDGIRCVAFIAHGNDTGHLLSRKGKVFKKIEHINRAVYTTLQGYPGLVLDGELFSRSLKFDEITSIVKQAKGVHKNACALEYHIYDCFYSDGQEITYENRLAILKQMLIVWPLVHVEEEPVECEDEVAGLLKKYERLGYEGIMLRNAKGIYEQDRRSPHLQKVKSFIDDEFEIVGGKSGIGRDAGTVIFKCQMSSGATFDVRPMGDKAKRTEYLTNLKNYIGKQLTVKYFELTKDGIPRFPTGVEIRDYEQQ